jgi:chromosome segregation ATPase
MISPRFSLVIALAATAALTAGLCCCTLRQGHSSPSSAPATPSRDAAPADAMAQRMRELDDKIARIERSLGKPPALSGTGAYAQGSTVRLAGHGQETLLERVRRLEQELAAAQATITAKQIAIAQMQRERDEARTQGTEARQEADYLARTRDDLTIAQQALRERQERNDALQAQVAIADLQRLRAERSWYALASEVLRLTPDELKDLPDIQTRIRDATREVREAQDGAGSLPSSTATPHRGHL